jgi:SAM-dependent methyltransferase
MAADPAWHPDMLESDVPCPACGGRQRKSAYTDLADRLYESPPASWSLGTCERCGSLVLDPRPAPATLHLAYTTYFTHDEGADVQAGAESGLRAAWRRLYLGYLRERLGYEHSDALKAGRWILPIFPRHRAAIERNIRHLDLPRPGARLLDVGCGNGGFLAMMGERGWETVGIDPDAKAVDAAVRRGLDVRQGDLEGLGDCEPFDAITLNHVIEHVYDPVAELTRARALLRPGGVLWLASPNAHGIGRRMFGPDWVGLDPPRHLTVFTPRALLDVVAAAGFANGRLLRPGLGFPALAGRWSSALARAKPPFDSGPPPASTRAALVLADRISFHLPRLADEVVLTAVAPPRTP